MSNILVLGGTSFYGRNLVEKLLKEGHKVTFFARGTNKSVESELISQGAVPIHGDRKDVGSFKDLFESQTEIYDAILDNTAMNGEDVKCVLETLGAKTRHYILCSSAAVYPDWDRLTPYREEEADLDYVSVTPDDRTDVKKRIANYANGKREAEKVLLSYAATIPFTILRPAVIEGPNDPTGRTWYWVQRLEQNIPVILPSSPFMPLARHVYVKDLVDFAYAVISNSPKNKAYNVVGDETISLDAYLNMIHSTLLGAEEKSSLTIVSVDKEIVQTKLQRFPAFFDHSLLLDNSAAKADYDFKPTPISEWLPETVFWASKNCALPEGSKDLYAEELRSASL